MVKKGMSSPRHRGGAGAAMKGKLEELDEIRLENCELKALLNLSGRTANTRRRRCCLLGFLLATVLILLFAVPLGLIKAVDHAVNRELPEMIQPYADWLMSHPLVPQSALELADSLFKQDSRPRSPGERLAAEGVVKKHPVVIVPGFTSTALELWSSDEKCASHVSPRSRIYSGPAMSMMTSNIRCWLAHMALNASTWQDRSGIKVRSASGLSSADYFGFAMESLFLWGKIIRELAALGYDEGSLHMASFDWRVALRDLETRDRYFTRTIAAVENLVASNQGEKAVVVCHSMGSNVWLYLMQFAEHREPGWVDKHVNAVVLVGGSTLGSPKVLNALLTGMTRETMSIWEPVRNIVESMIGRQDLASLFRSWGSMPVLLPVGGEALWGNATWAPDDDEVSPCENGTECEEGAASSTGRGGHVISFSSNTPSAAAGSSSSSNSAASISQDEGGEAFVVASESTEGPPMKFAAFHASTSAAAQALAPSSETSKLPKRRERNASSSSSSSSSNSSVGDEGGAAESAATSQHLYLEPVERAAIAEERRRLLLGLFDDSDNADDEGNAEEGNTEPQEASLANQSLPQQTGESKVSSTPTNARVRSSDDGKEEEDSCKEEELSGECHSRSRTQRTPAPRKLTVVESHALLREVSPRYGDLVDRHYDFALSGPQAPSASALKRQKQQASQGGGFLPGWNKKGMGEERGGGADGKGRWVAGLRAETTWSNPLAAPLPHAPGMTLYCLHGSGVPTDRAFTLTGSPDYSQTTKDNSPPQSTPPAAENVSGAADSTAASGGSDSAIDPAVTGATTTAGATTASAAPQPQQPQPRQVRHQDGLPFVVDESATDAAHGVSGGVRLADGDGTLTSLALGFPCARLWKDSRYNPGEAAVVLREYKHLNAESFESLRDPKAFYSDVKLGSAALHERKDNERGINDDSSSSSRSDGGQEVSPRSGDGQGMLETAPDPESAEAFRGLRVGRARLSSCGAAPVVEGAEKLLSPQCLSVDLNGDGVWDAHVWDLDGDGQPDSLDFDGDGTPDVQFLPQAGELDTILQGAAAAAAASTDSLHGRNSEPGGEQGVGGGAGDIGTGLDDYFKAALALLREADLGAFGRGLGLASDHVNILGNNALISDLLRIATGTKTQDGGAAALNLAPGGGKADEESPAKQPLLPDKIHSRVLEMASKVAL